MNICEQCSNPIHDRQWGIVLYDGRWVQGGKVVGRKPPTERRVVHKGACDRAFLESRGVPWYERNRWCWQELGHHYPVSGA